MTQNIDIAEPISYKEALTVIGGSAPQVDEQMRVEDIEIKEEPIREIISKPPSWLVQWGVTVIAVIVAMLLLLSFLLKYPNTLSGKVSITTTALPMSIKARSSGYLADLRVKDGQAVKKGEILGILENTADEKNLLIFRSQWQGFHKQLMQSDDVPALLMSKRVDFGEIQPAYIQLWGAYQLYENFMERGAYSEQLRQNKRQLQGSNAIIDQLSEQESLLKEGLRIAQNQYEVDKALEAKGAITKRELQQSKQRLQEREMAWERWDGSKLQERLRLEELQGKAIDIQQRFERERQQYLSTLRQASLNFASALADWEQKYLLKANIEGKVALFQLWSERQWIEAGQEVMVVSPESEEIFGLLLVDQAGSGQLEEGQKVYIKLAGYPSERFGQVKGKVKAISSIARGGKYAVKVALPNGLATTYDKLLPFHQQMEGDAEVITEDLRLIERFFYQMRSLMDEN